MHEVNVTLTELKSLAVKHQKSNIFTQFALARKTPSLLDEATSVLLKQQASYISTLQYHNMVLIYVLMQVLVY
jgi:hypothetical protein